MTAQPPRRRSLDDLVAADPPGAPQPGAAIEAAGPQARALAAAGPGGELHVRRRDLAAAGAVLMACDSAQRTPRLWVAYSLRLHPALADRLVRRVAVDADANPHVPLARNHYLEAALDALPFGDLEALAEIGRGWQAARPRAVSGRAPSPGTTLHQDTAAAMRSLSRWLPTLPDKVLTQDVGAGALAALLDELDINPITGSA
jgi:hypothetical protein